MRPSIHAVSEAARGFPNCGRRGHRLALEVALELGDGVDLDTIDVDRAELGRSVTLEVIHTDADRQGSLVLSKRQAGDSARHPATLACAHARGGDEAQEAGCRESHRELAFVA
jgi:hypothetical protein